MRGLRRTRIVQQVKGHPGLALAGVVLAGWAGWQVLQRTGQRVWTQVEVHEDAVQLPRASLADTLLFLNEVLRPSTGMTGFLRSAGRRLGERLDPSLRAVQRMHALRERYGAGPLLLALPRRNLALVLAPDHALRVLEQTPAPFAGTSDETHGLLKYLQPHAAPRLHGPPRAVRRLHEDALDAHQPRHTLADPFRAQARAESRHLLHKAADQGELDWPTFYASWQRMARVVLLGQAARDDIELTDLLARLGSHASRSFLAPRQSSLQARFNRRLTMYLQRGEAGSLAGHLARLGYGPQASADQVPRWLFALDAAGIAAYRALALIAAHPRFAGELIAAGVTASGAAEPAPQQALLRASLFESIRLWPTTPIIARETTRATRWGAGHLPAGTGVLIYTPLFHRDEHTLPFAHRFAPEIWDDNLAAERNRLGLLPFSDGPRSCPGGDLALLLGSELLAALLAQRLPRLVDEWIDGAHPLPGTLEPASLRFRLV
jgi:hypothetical protein